LTLGAGFDDALPRPLVLGAGLEGVELEALVREVAVTFLLLILLRLTFFSVESFSGTF
jgi:hypothetical protein